MIRSLRLLLLVGMLFVTAESAHAAGGLANLFNREAPKKDPSIKVLLVSDAEGAMIQVEGSYKIFDPNTGRRLAYRTTGKTAFIQPVGEGLKWGETFPGVYQVAFVPDRANGSILVNGHQYKGDVIVYHVEGKIFVVNEVAVDDYVESVLTSELDRSLSREAMNAMVIVVRTEASHAIETAKSPLWHVRASDKGYTGYSVTQRNPAIAKAVAGTRNMILTIPSNKDDQRTAFVPEWETQNDQELTESKENAVGILNKLYPSARLERTR